MSSLGEILDSARSSEKRVIVVGLGITGVESARFLQHYGITVLVVEKITEEKFRSLSKRPAQVDELRSEGIEVLFGVDGERITPHLSGVALVVVSPGVSLESSIIGAIKRHNVPYVSELELSAHLHHGPVVVVSGSNGKSTTAILIDQMLCAGGLSSRVCGTIGAPILTSSSVSGADADESIMVTEASSYQLEASTVLKPAVSVVLNISDNHLERHGSLERYAAVMGRAIRLQSKGDLSVMNADDPLVRELSRSCRGGVALFGSMPESELASMASMWARIGSGDTSGDSVVVSRAGVREEYVTTNARLLGRHNRYNMAAAILVARQFGVAPHVVRKALLACEPLEHRLEVFWRDAHRVIINDSTATTVAASRAGIATVFEHFASFPVTLMIGGLSKAGSWAPLLRMIHEHRQSRTSLVCFGHDRSLLASHCRSAGFEPIISQTLREATREALATVEEGGVVLLSPGCSSFDEFVDFEHRGVEFKRYVLEDVGQGARGAL